MIRGLLILLLCLLSRSLFAESQPVGTVTYDATKTYRAQYFSYEGFGTSSSSACAAAAAKFNGTCTTSSDTEWSGLNSSGSPVAGGVSISYTCPSGGSGGSANSQCTINGGCPLSGGWTQNGSTCTRPDCNPGESRDQNGVCLSACQQVKDLINGTPQAKVWVTVPVGSSNAMGSYCDSGCAVSLGVDQPGYYTDGKTNTFSRAKHYSGSSCTTEPNMPTQNSPDKQPPVPEKKPPCAAAEGVMTSSSGTVACVPEGTPSSNPPVVKKSTTSTTKPDGSIVKEETTTTRDPATGAESTSKTTTTTSPGGSSTVESSTGDSSSGTNSEGKPDGTGQNDFCAKNPGLQICKGGMNEEATQKKVFDEAEKVAKASEKIRDFLDPTDFDPESSFAGNEQQPLLRQVGFAQDEFFALNLPLVHPNQARGGDFSRPPFRAPMG